MNWIRSKEMTILLQLAPQKHPGLADMPDVFELVKRRPSAPPSR